MTKCRKCQKRLKIGEHHRACNACLVGPKPEPKKPTGPVTRLCANCETPIGTRRRGVCQACWKAITERPSP